MWIFRAGGFRCNGKRRLTYVVRWVVERWFMFLWPQLSHDIIRVKLKLGILDEKIRVKHVIKYKRNCLTVCSCRTSHFIIHNIIIFEYFDNLCLPNTGNEKVNKTLYVFIYLYVICIYVLYYIVGKFYKSASTIPFNQINNALCLNSYLCIVYFFSLYTQE